MTAADEQQLIAQVKEGNKAAFRALVERHMKQAYNIAFGVLGVHEHAEDVTQEAFVRLHASISSFRGGSALSTWLYRIVMNLSLNRLRQEQRRDAREVRREYETEHTGTTPDYAHREYRDHIERALHELPTMQRAVVMLRQMDGLSTKQVSSILKCSEGTVKTHLFRGLRTLRMSLEYLKAEIV
jgi:RNA polymerase sigma-70 factor (ECF subfamily)